jgi:mono/diheme cytochrome c family protein
MTSGTVRFVAIAAVAAALAAASPGGRPASAQDSARPKDYLQRSLEIYEFRKAANSGPDRGQEIYYYKCWFCHNEFVATIPQQGIPHLKGLYQKPNLLSGEPVNDGAVKEKIKNGGPGMPAYKYVLNDADLNDLVSYLREKCCWNSDAPPPNPRFRGN